MSELAEERSIGGGAKRAKIRVNAVTHGGAGAFGLIDIYCAILFIRDSDSCQAAGSSYPTTAWTDPHARGAGIPVAGTLPTGWRVLSCSISGYP